MSPLTPGVHIDLRFASTGTGPIVLLLHAFPFDGRMWRAQIAELASDHTVIAPDLPGFGKSPPPDGSPSLDDWAGAILAHCKGGGIDHAVVAGCSIGGYIAFAMQRADPTFASAFALIDTRASTDTQDARRARYEMVEKARHEGTGFLQQSTLPISPRTLENKPDVVAALRAMQAAAVSTGVMAAQRAMAGRKDARDLLGSIAVPTCVIHGLDDPVISHAEAESMAASIPGARFVPIADSGHLPPIEQPEAVTAALRSLSQATKM